MKLYLIKAKEQTKPWEPWYDKAFGFVVRATSERMAREFATENAGDEKRKCPTCWEDPEFSTCEELTAEGVAGLILSDYKSA